MSRRQISIASVVSAVLALACILVWSATARAAATITEYSLGPSSNPQDIVPGPNGDIWFDDEGLCAVNTLYNAAIGEVNPSTHAIQEFPTGLACGSFGGIAAGPDGNIWFTDQNAPAIGVFSVATHKIQEFSTGQPTASMPQSIAAGPNGELWFTDAGDNSAIGEISPTSHAISEFALPGGDMPNAIAPGPNGEMWFTVDGYHPAIGEINPTTHAIQLFSGGLTVHNGPEGIAAGPDGNMWFADAYGAIGEISPTTDAIQEFSSGLPSGSGPHGITAGAGGGMWFTDANTPAIGVINPTSHTIAEVTSSSLTEPENIAAGPDNTTWFTDPSTPAIGEVTLGASKPATPSVGHVTVSGTAAHVPLGCAGSGTCSFKLTMSVTETIRRGKVIAVAAQTTKRVVVVGSASRSLSGGKSSEVTLALNGQGKALLARHHTLKVKLVVTSGSSTVTTTILTFVKHPKM